MLQKTTSFNYDQKQRYGLRKFKGIGLASALLGVAYLGLNNQVAHADTTNNVPTQQQTPVLNGGGRD